MSDENKNVVRLKTETLRELFSRNLVIPEYQRAYEWKTDHVVNLFNDTFNASLKEKPYLMGTIILHKDEKLDIVDGQQRLITLTILINLLQSDFSSNENQKNVSLSLLEATFDNVKSFYYLKNTKSKLKDLLERISLVQKVEFLKYLQDMVRFSVLEISGNNALDLAYTFFDSLNSKGKGLSDFDLLKAHHLMFIPEEQESLARQHNDDWQSKDDKHQLLFSTILRRIRMWSRGQERDSKIERNDFYEFISVAEPNELEIKEHFFNRYMQPNLFRSWCRENDKIVLNMKMPQQDAELLLPMEIPQTIEGGDAFFLYAKRYHGLYETLFDKNDLSVSTALQYASNLSKAISNKYLKMAFESIILLYYDKFGEQRLIEVATCTELIISKWGFNSGSIRIEGTLTEIKNQNLIPIVLNSTVSSHVVSQLTKIIVCKNIEKQKGIKNVYLNQIQKFYRQNISKIKDHLLREKVKFTYNIDQESK